MTTTITRARGSVRLLAGSVLAIAAVAKGSWLLLFIGLSSGGAMLLGPFAARLQALQQRHGGELALLSLLPGFGGAPRVRGYLLRAILRPYLAACGGVLALMAAAAR